MTHPELVEAMARAIGHEIWGGEVDPRGKWKLAAQAALAVARPQIEASLLESMETVSEWMRKEAGALDCLTEAEICEHWRAMLAAFRKEHGL